MMSAREFVKNKLIEIFEKRKKNVTVCLRLDDTLVQDMEQLREDFSKDMPDRKLTLSKLANVLLEGAVSPYKK